MAVLDAATGATVRSYSQAGPASYSTGGLLLNASADFSWLGFVDPLVVTRGVLPPVDFEVLLNRDLSSLEAPGQATIKVVRGRYDRATMGNVSGQPGGVTVRAAKTAAGNTTGSGHTHTIDHDHPAQLSNTETAVGGSVLLALGGGNMRNHNHMLNVPALVAAPSTSTTHTHDRSYEYDHNHAKTVATVSLTAVEIAAATNLSGVTFRMVVYGFGRA